MTSCRMARRWIELSFAGSLPLEETLRLEAHTAECADCRTRALADRRLLDALEALPVPPEEHVDLDRVLQKIHARIDTAAKPTQDDGQRTAEAQASAPLDMLPTTRRRRSWWVASAAAAAAVALGTWIARSTTGSRESHEAASPIDRPEDSDLARGGVPESAPGSPATRDGSAAEPSDLAASPGVHVVPYPEWGPTDLDRGKLAEVQDMVRARLATAAAGIELEPLLARDPRAAEALARELDASCEAFGRLGWPLAELVGRFARDEDPVVAAAAVRYLGRRGGRVHLARLEAAASRTDIAPAALHALAELAALDAGTAPTAERVLARALWNPDLTESVLAHVEGWRARSSERVVTWVGAALAAAPHANGQFVSPATENVANRLPGLLASCRLDGARELIRLIGHPLVRADAVLEALAASADGATALLAELEDRSSRTDPRRERQLLAALDRLRPLEAYSWVLERAWYGSARDQAVYVLAGYPGAQPAADLLEVAHTTRVAERDLVAAFQRALAVDGARMALLATQVGELDDPNACERYLEWLVLAGRPAGAEAILTLVRDGDLRPRDRERALLVAGELGGPEDAALAQALFEEWGAAERELAAANLITLHRLGGEQALRDALAGTSEDELGALIDLCTRGERARSSTSTLIQLERELEPILRAREALNLR